MSDGELDALRRENHALNQQIKLLVQTEQQLYRSQNELDAQLQRQGALARFSYESAPTESASSILARALAAIEEGVAMHHGCVVRLDPRAQEATALAVLGEGGDVREAVTLPADVWAWASGLAAPLLVDRTDAATFAAVHALVERVTPGRLPRDPKPGRGRFACVPLRVVSAGASGLLILYDTGPHHAVPRPDALAPSLLPFLRLFGSHIERALDTMLLTERLHERGEQLANSLATLESTQRELLQSQKLEAVGRLAGGVAHDFNNLLTVILGYAGMLQGTLEPGTPSHDSARQILEAGQRASATTRQLLALGRRQIQRREDFDLSEQADRTATLLRRLVGEDISLTLELDRGLAPVRADRSQFEQVLLNLIVNARDAMPEGGRMRVITRAAAAEDAARAETPVDAARFAALEVIDTGIGMDRETRARIFEPFFTTKPPGAGTGLGLAVVYGIVKQSEGHVLVDSEPGRGARFTVLLPHAGAAPAFREAAEDTGPPPGPHARVLVVEDEASIRDVVLATLRRAGHEVHAVADGQEALDWMAAQPSMRAPDLVLTDVLMPRVGGVRLAAALHREHPRLRVAFMSGYSEDLLVREGGAGRREAFLAKPFTPEQLLAFVSRLLA